MSSKKTVGIITFHFVNNYGGVLQTYALRNTVEKYCNAETTIIDYRNWFIRLTDRIRLLPITSNPEEIRTGLATMSDRIGRRRKFGMFTKSYGNITSKYHSSGQLNKHCPRLDKYICGSDQIWNPVLTFGVVPCYYLDFEKDNNKKIAYAPSFGGNRSILLFRKTIGKYICNIEHLSVREKTGQDLIFKLTGRKAERLIDPTFLLDRDSWCNIAKAPEEREPYILLYIMQRDEEVYGYARRLKEEKGLKIIEISRYGYNPGFIDEIMVNVGPEEFLGLFQNADFICTNSYHGLAFSIIFDKEFCVIPSKRFVSRINNLLDLLNIDVDYEKMKSLKADYDKNAVKAIIDNERKKSIEYLNGSINC